MNSEEKVKLIQELYEKVLQEANYFLYNAKTFDIKILRGEDPTYEYIADCINKTCGILSVLCEDDDVNDPLTAQKATEYCEYMKGMAIAIKNMKDAELKAFVRKLDGRSFL